MNKSDLKGLRVMVKHYSQINPLNSYIVSNSDSSLSIELTKAFHRVCLLEYDPIVIAFENKSTINILGGDISKILF